MAYGYRTWPYLPKLFLHRKIRATFINFCHWFEPAFDHSHNNKVVPIIDWALSQPRVSSTKSTEILLNTTPKLKAAQFRQSTAVILYSSNMHNNDEKKSYHEPKRRKLSTLSSNTYGATTVIPRSTKLQIPCNSYQTQNNPNLIFEILNTWK